MRPDWANEEDGEGGKPHAHRPGDSDLPIIDPDEDDEFDDEDDDDDDEFETEEVLEAEIDSEPRTVLITGACGNIGRKLRTAWEDVYDLILIDAAADEDDPEVLQGRPDPLRRGLDHPLPRRRHRGPPRRQLERAERARRPGAAQHRRPGQRLQRGRPGRRRPGRLREFEPRHGRIQGRRRRPDHRRPASPARATTTGCSSSSANGWARACRWRST